MAKSGYAGEVLNTYYLRFYWSTTYHPETNTSTVSIMPEESGGGSFGGEMIGTDFGGTGTSGVYINGVLKYKLDQQYGGDNKNFKNSAADWYHDFEPTVGSIGTAEVTHDSNGNATFTARVKCTIFPYNFPTAGVYRKDLDTGTVTVTFHENAPYAISYNANGGSGAPSSQSVYANIQYNLSNTKPTRTGYNFLGWSTSSTATTATYAAGAAVTPTGNLALYAVWSKKSFTLSISQGTGSTISVKRNGTTLNNGATIYYGDVLAISISANTGYNINKHTVNGTNWTSGNHTVTDAVSVISTATLITYTLSITTSAAGVTPNIRRTSSPIGGGSTGQINNGATLYYNDVISVNYTIGGAYQLQTATVNNVDISGETLPYVVTARQNIIVSITAKLGAIVYIGNEAYQAFIGNGTDWVQCQAYIGNGSSWDTY